MRFAGLRFSLLFTQPSRAIVFGNRDPVCILSAWPHGFCLGSLCLLSFIESPAIEMVIKKRYLLNWADTASVYPVTDHIAHKVYILGRSILHEAHP